GERVVELTQRGELGRVAGDEELAQRQRARDLRDRPGEPLPDRRPLKRGAGYADELGLEPLDGRGDAAFHLEVEADTRQLDEARVAEHAVEQRLRRLPSVGEPLRAQVVDA